MTINTVLILNSYMCTYYMHVTFSIAYWQRDYSSLYIKLTLKYKVFYFFLHTVIHTIKHFIFPIIHLSICYIISCLCTFTLLLWIEKMTATEDIRYLIILKRLQFPFIYNKTNENVQTVPINSWTQVLNDQIQLKNLVSSSHLLRY